MKLSDLITERLTVLGVEKPSSRLVDEVEKLISSRIRAAVGKVTPRIAARAFAATLAPVMTVEKGVLGDALALPQASSEDGLQPPLA